MIIKRKITTLTTDSNGRCSYRYNSEGIGDVTFGASFNDDESNLLIQTFIVQDCLKYYDGEQSPNVPFNFTLTNPVKIEFEANKPSNNSGGYIEIGRTDYWLGVGWVGSTSSKMWLYERRSAGTMAQYVQTNDLPVNDWLPTVLELNGTTAKLTINNQTITMNNIQVDLTPLHQISSGATVKYKNIKIKPL